MDWFEQQKTLKQAEQDQAWQDMLDRRRHYKECFSTPAGRYVLKDLMVRSCMFSTTYTGNAASHFLEGKRMQVLDILAHVPELAGEVVYDHGLDREQALQDMETNRKKD